jgi:hypothetical protein
LLDLAAVGSIAGAEDPQQASPHRAGDGIGVRAEGEKCCHRGQRGEAGDPEQDTAHRIPFQIGRHGRTAVTRRDAAGQRPPQQGEVPEPPGRQRDHDDKGDAIGDAEDRTEADRCADAADGGAQRPPSDRGHHQRQRRQIKQQQRDQRAGDDRGEHQRRRAAGRQGYDNDHDHQLSRSFRAVRGSLNPNHRQPDDPGAL